LVSYVSGSEADMKKSAINPRKQPRRLCGLCGAPIAPERLEALPNASTCIDCARKHPVKVDVSRFDLSEASPINRNGFAPKD
jgi:hypothetical protein